MTAKELATMVSTMRKQGTDIPTRIAMEKHIHRLICGLRSIKRNDLSDELEKLYDEIENVDTTELVKTGVFDEANVFKIKFVEFAKFGYMPEEETVRSIFDSNIAGWLDENGDYYHIHMDHRSHKRYAVSEENEERARQLGRILEEGETAVFNGESVRAMTYEEERKYNEDNLMLLVDLWGNVCTDEKENEEWSKWYHDHY